MCARIEEKRGLESRGAIIYSVGLARCASSIEVLALACLCIRRKSVDSLEREHSYRRRSLPLVVLLSHGADTPLVPLPSRVFHSLSLGKSIRSAVRDHDGVRAPLDDDCDTTRPACVRTGYFDRDRSSKFNFCDFNSIDLPS